ncbi:tyrosine-protein phosphatase [Nonomuraea sp. NPDC050451]|uniref:tyrosine-protein phosphatase n=1 Tax=Nonomuraea sp. NPDC050451 TaxID=3364364 RepID=UPI0037ABCB3A
MAGRATSGHTRSDGPEMAFGRQVSFERACREARRNSTDPVLCTLTIGMAGPDRHLDGEGCISVRELDSISVTSGGVIRWGAVVRSDTPERLTTAGWSALVAPGVRTAVDLRNHDDPCARLPAPRTAGPRAQDVPVIRERFIGAAG